MLLLLLTPLRASAHGANLSFLDLSVEGSRIDSALQIPVEEAHALMALTARSASNAEERQEVLAAWFVQSVRLVTEAGVCTGAPGDVRISNDPVAEIRASYTCPGSTDTFEVYSRLLDAMGRDHVTFVRLEAGEYQHQAMLTAGNSHARFELGSGSAWEEAGKFLILGMEHIFLGFDHVLFLLTLILIGGSLRRLILVATSFTVAHSITLSLAALELVALPERFIESVIALSIGWVAIENIRYARPRAGGMEPLALRLRWVLTFAFGLIHGFGFAGVLTDLGLPRQHLVAALGSFNLGVELGQIAILCAAYPILKRLEFQSWYRPRGVQFASLGVLALSLFWFVERAFFW